MKSPPGGSLVIASVLFTACSPQEGDPVALRDSPPRHIQVRLPERANRAMRLQDLHSSLAIEVRLVGARDKPPVEQQGLLVFHDALGDGTDVTLRPHEAGVEDLVAFSTRPQPELVSYDIKLIDVAGLRQVGGGVEFLDAPGSPRLRVAPPFILDSAGDPHTANLLLKNCNYDTDPRGPWGRPVTPAGAAECRLEVSWERGITYPAVLDPQWTTTTDTLGVARKWPMMVTLSGGRALLCGGQISSGASTNNCELFEPSNTTWSFTGNMRVARRWFTMTRLLDNRVLAAAGLSTTSELTAETFDETNAMWTDTQSLKTSRYLHSATLLSNGTVLVAGGQAGATRRNSAELFTPNPDGWTNLAPLGNARSQHAAARLPGDRVLVAGGSDGAAYQGAEVYDSTSGWRATLQPLGFPRWDLTATSLSDGRVLLAGGYDGTLINIAEIFNPTGETFSTSQMGAAHDAHTATLLINGSVLIAGGCSTTSCASGVTASEIFDFTTGNWVGTPPLKQARAVHGSTALLDGTVLVAGGSAASVPVMSSEVFSLGAAGEPCTQGGECQSGS
ncbi:MAG TPA: hypothetical protein VGJ84_02245, partial [Polyangiaceae bacterium]